MGSCIWPLDRTLSVPDLFPHSIIKIADKLQRMAKNKGTKGYRFGKERKPMTNDRSERNVCSWKSSKLSKPF